MSDDGELQSLEAAWTEKVMFLQILCQRNLKNPPPSVQDWAITNPGTLFRAEPEVVGRGINLPSNVPRP